MTHIAIGRERTIEIGTTSLETLAFATAIPATALVTDTAGVKIPSASVRLVPKRAYNALIAESASCLRRRGKQHEVRTQIRSGQRIEVMNDLFVRGLEASVSPVSVLSTFTSWILGGYNPWKRANVPPSPAPRRMIEKALCQSRQGSSIATANTFCCSKPKTDENLNQF